MQTDVVATALDELVRNVVEVVPNLVGGLVFLAIAAVGVKLLMIAVRSLLGRVFPDESPVYRQFVATIVLAFLWFGVALSFLSIVGLTAIAASLGTATGFLALGVSYALSNMIEDAVAGVYLLRDPDFNQGDRVTAADVTGEVQAIELRKTRFDVDGDTVVLANAAIETQWTKEATT